MPAASASSLIHRGKAFRAINPVSSALADFAVVRAMERKLPLTFVAVIFSTILLLSGCQKKNAGTDSNSQGESESHKSTKILQAADLVGYNGTKLRKSVDHIREASDKHTKVLEKMVESRPDQ
jgi:protein-tyrosine phosphatase